MIKNYFKTAWRNIWKNKVTSLMNLLGLSIGMTAAVFIFLWVQNEASFNSYHPDANNIYRITNSIQVNKDEAWIWESSPLLMGQTALKEIPEVKNAARIAANTWSSPIFNVNHRLFSEKTSAWMDKSWFDMFHYDFVQGSADNFGKERFSLILTESKAKKYFGEADAIGQLIRVDKVNYIVQGIIKDNPVNSSFQFDVLLQLEGRLSDPATYHNYKNWNNFGYITFLKLRPSAKK